jgi:lysozyme
MSTAPVTPSPRLPGIDVSGYQNKIDWKTLAPYIRFAFIKATDGAYFTDSHVAENVKGATDNGIPFGLYHFFRNGGSIPGDESKRFLDVFAKYPSQLPPVLDLEVHPSTDGIGSLPHNALAFLEDVCPHAWPMVYTSPSYASLYLSADFTQFPLWVAHYTSAPKPLLAQWSKWSFWQWSAKGSVPGVIGDVDLDWCADEDTLASLLRVPT